MRNRQRIRSQRFGWLAGLTFPGLLAMLPGTGYLDEGTSSGVPAWRYVGPDGASADDVAIDPANPRRLYLVSNRGVVFRSDDGAANWEAVSEFRLGPEWEERLVLGPVTRDTVYLICSALWKSSDAGRSWNKVLGRGAVTGARVACVAMHPFTSSTLYAGTYDCVFKSTDAGGTWFKASAGIENASVLSLAVDPANARALYAGTGGGIFKSTDGAMTWAKANSGLPKYEYALDLCVARGRTRIVFAGTDDGAVYKSTDAGETWNRVKRVVGFQAVCRVSIDPLRPDTAYLATDAGAFATADGGKTWAPVGGLPLDEVCRIVVGPSDPKTLYAGTPAGIFRSTDRGRNWDLLNSGMRECPVTALAIDPIDPAVIYAGSDGGVMKSTDGGATWRLSNGGCPKLVHVKHLAIDPANPARLYACRGDGFVLLGAYQSRDGGISWARMGLAIDRIVVDPLTPSTIYGGGGNVYKSTDWGTTWRQCGNLGEWWGALTALEADPVAPNTVYAGYQYGPICRSTDGGTRWEVLPIGDSGYGGWRMAIDPGPPVTLYAGEPNDTVLWRSTDRGSTWKRTTLPTKTLVSLFVCSGARRAVYAGTDGEGIFRSTDGGTTWQRVNQGLTRKVQKQVQVFASSTARPDTMYAATEAGVFQLEVVPALEWVSTVEQTR